MANLTYHVSHIHCLASIATYDFMFSKIFVIPGLSSQLPRSARQQYAGARFWDQNQVGYHKCCTDTVKIFKLRFQE